MKKIKRIGLLIIGIIVLNVLLINSYATSVTKQNLNEALQKFVSSDANENNYKITVSDNDITIVVEGKSYTLKYDLTEKPKFTLEIPVMQGMSYDDFKEKTNNLILPMVGYIAVANIQGIEIEDASTYFLMTFMENIFNGSTTNEDTYVIVDDRNRSEGSDTKTIYASEFGKRVMEYVNATYKEKQILKDASNGIDSYEWEVERKDVTDTSCKLVSSLSVNLNADFQQINGYKEKFNESLLNKQITKENADYAINLKVGQKCRIETTEKITGHALSGTGYEYKKINDTCVEITGQNVGKANGYIGIGEANSKSIFITVEENTANVPLDTIVLKIDTTSGTDKLGANNEQKEEKIKASSTNKSNKSTGGITSKTSLPKAGISRIILIGMWLCIGGIIIFRIKLKKYKDIK